MLVVLAGAALPLGCGGDQSTTVTKPRTSPVVVEGRLVPIGGGRSLFIDCVGSGRPTVVLEAGFGGDTRNWATVQPEIGRTTRTCAYDRAGLGNSVALPGVHDARTELADLQHLLTGARLPAPYVLVGHSYGGLLARLFARAHPNEVGGLVLVDAMGRDQTTRTLALWPKRRERALRRDLATAVHDGVDLRAGETLAAGINTLGALPMAVVTAGRHDDEWGRVYPLLRRRLDRLWARMQDELAALSSNHLHAVARHSDHFVQGIEGQPDVVVRSVDAVVRAVRGHAPLPPCRGMFPGSGVRCRP